MYTSSFRRLSGKSQVVGSVELGSFHTRLTHSLKVAQIGRRIAERLRHDDVNNPLDPPSPDLIDFACLGHDLGHPPFGHAGERALDAALERQLSGPAASVGSDILEANRLALGGFEGNPQSFRIVSRLAHKWLPSDGQEGPELPDWFGLDLTAGSLDAMSKYPWARVDPSLEKWGCYGMHAPNDAGTLEWARSATGAAVRLGVGAAKSFECQVMDWCDDVTYAVHDVEDFYQIGFIPMEFLFASDEPTEEWTEFRTFVVDKWNRKEISITSDELDEARLDLVNNVVAIAVAGAFRGTNLERRLAHRRTSGLIHHFVEAVTFSGTPMLHDGEFLVHADTDQARLLRLQCDLLKELIWKYVINSPSLGTQQAGHRRIISDLVQVYCETPNLLPVHLREMLDDHEARTGYADAHLAKLRVVADHVSSLTEQHAMALHRRLTGIDPGGFRDLV